MTLYQYNLYSVSKADLAGKPVHIRLYGMIMLSVELRKLTITIFSFSESGSSSHSVSFVASSLYDNIIKTTI